MQRLYWKIFLSFWAALVLFAGATILVSSAYLDRLREEQSAINPRAFFAQHVADAQAAALQDGLDGLKDWARGIDRTEAIPWLVLNEGGEDVLGREVPPYVGDRLARRFEQRPRMAEHMRNRFAPVIRLADGTPYHLVPDHQSVTLGRVLGRPRVIAVPLLLAALVSGVVCFLLARYLTAPIDRLRRAADGYAAGKLDARVGPSMGRRRDELAQLARAFDRMAERLHASMQSHKQLLRDVSHELRSPLARLQAALGLARQRAGTDTQPQLDRIELEAERLNELIGQLLSLARLESGAVERNFERVDLTEILQTVVADAALEAQARHCEVRLEHRGPLSTSGDPQLLHSALENVVRNAVRYTREGTTVAVHAGADPASPNVLLIRVADCGPGVPDALLPRLFEPFVRADDARDRAGGGYGLGLAIAERAVRVHGGTIVAHNEPAGGLTVAIRLPAHATDT